MSLSNIRTGLVYSLLILNPDVFVNGELPSDEKKQIEISVEGM